MLYIYAYSALCLFFFISFFRYAKREDGFVQVKYLPLLTMLALIPVINFCFWFSVVHQPNYEKFSEIWDRFWDYKL